MSSYFTDAIELDDLLVNLPPGIQAVEGNIVRGSRLQSDDTMYVVTEGSVGLLFSVLEGPGDMAPIEKHYNIEMDTVEE